MDYCFCSLVAKEDLQGVYKTILMFLEAQGFKETAKVFQQECASMGLQIGPTKQVSSTLAGSETLETALQQVMTTLKKIEYSITHGQKDVDVTDVLDSINAKLRVTRKNDVVEVVEEDSEESKGMVVVEEKPEVDYRRLDFARIKHDLLYGSVDEQLSLITSLQMAIIYKRDHRDLILDSLIRYDILYLKKAEINLVCYYLKNCKIECMQERMSRFVNTIASLKRGRDYLTSNDTFIQVLLFPNLLRQNISYISRNMLIATLQKLSLRYASRSLMIRLGLLEFITDFLEEANEKTSRYCLEYCSALLMNLCLELEGRNRCGGMPKKIVNIMRKMLKGEIACCLPCVNGTLYSILLNKQVNGEAKLQKLDQILLHVSKTASDEDIKKQLNIILWSRFNGDVDQCPVTIPHQELENEEEYLESELTGGIQVLDSDIDDFFRNYMQEHQENDQLKMMCRPATPASFKKSFSRIETMDSNEETPNEQKIIEYSEYPKPPEMVVSTNHDLDSISCPSERREHCLPRKMKRREVKSPVKVRSRKCVSEAERYTKVLPQPEWCTQNAGCKCPRCIRFGTKLKKIYKMCVQ